METNDIIEKLNKVPFFQGLKEDVTEKLHRITASASFSRGDVVFEEGAAADSVYFIVDGEVDVLKTIDRDKGSYKSLGIIRSGEIFGELAFFDSHPRSADIKARTDLTVIRIRMEDFERFLLEDTQSASIVLSGIIAVLARRIREGGNELAALYEAGKIIGSSVTIQEITDRVCALLLQSVPSADSCLIGVYNKFTREYDIQSSLGLSAVDIGDKTISESDPAMVRLLEPGHFLEGNPAESKLFGEGRFTDTNSMIASLLHSGNETLGFIGLFNRGQSGAFTPAQKNLLAGLASQLSPALQNVAFRREEEDRERLRRFRY